MVLRFKHWFLGVIVMTKGWDYISTRLKAPENSRFHHSQKLDHGKMYRTPLEMVATKKKHGFRLNFVASELPGKKCGGHPKTTKTS